VVGHEPYSERRGAVRLTLRQATREFQRAYLRQLMRETGGRVAEAARRAGVSRTALCRTLRELGVIYAARRADAPRDRRARLRVSSLYGRRGNAAWQALGDH
jgi:hypothetical protein